jgi:hypothetical protein
MKHWTFIVISSHFAGKAGTKTGDPKESGVGGITTAQQRRWYNTKPECRATANKYLSVPK